MEVSSRRPLVKECSELQPLPVFPFPGGAEAPALLHFSPGSTQGIAAAPLLPHAAGGMAVRGWRWRETEAVPPDKLLGLFSGFVMATVT